MAGEALRGASSPAQAHSTDAPHDPASGSLSFRPDIQGIRALAVLLVVVNHLAPARLPGGYIGVDVFFVVSGYLITALLLGESRRTGRISLTGFYARRARRILPAATVVTLTTVVVSLLTLPLLRVQTILTDAVWATFFAANVREASTGTDYFAAGQPPSPLRHFWSLAVEEQFYLVWPLLLLACLALVRAKGGSKRDLRLVAGAVVLGIVVVSLAWSAMATHESPVTAYYSTLARGWELGLGAACAAFAGRSALSATSRQVLALLGLTAIAAATLWYSGATSFPGTAALLPVLGTAALLVAGDSGGHTAVGRMLAIRPMVIVGAWSYSLYLWHWPVIVLLRSNLGPERFGALPVRLGTLVLVLVLGWASFRWIETPFRHGAWRGRSRALLIYPVSIATVLATVALCTQSVHHQLGGSSDEPAIAVADYLDQGLGRDPYVALVRASARAAEEGRAVPGDLTPGLLDLRAQVAPLGDCDYRTGTTDLCPVGDPDADRTIVLFGDSHARALSPALQKIGAEHGYRVYVLVYSGCSANNLVQVDPASGRAWAECEGFKDWAKSTIDALRPDLLVVSTAAGVVLDSATGEVVRSEGPDLDHYLSLLGEGWTDILLELAPSAQRVVLVGNTPKLPSAPGSCLSRGEPDLGECAFRPRPKTRHEAAVSFAAAAAADVETVDALRWFCARRICPPVVGSLITLRDTEHMTPDYARWLAAPLADALGIVTPAPRTGAAGEPAGRPHP